jgi:hypothetical protein
MERDGPVFHFAPIDSAWSSCGAGSGRIAQGGRAAQTSNTVATFRAQIQCEHHSPSPCSAASPLSATVPARRFRRRARSVADSSAPFPALKTNWAVPSAAILRPLRPWCGGCRARVASPSGRPRDRASLRRDGPSKSSRADGGASRRCASSQAPSDRPRRCPGSFAA